MKSIVILSGGLDSTTALAGEVTAIREQGGSGQDVLALTFLYGQTHSKELQCAAWQAQRWGTHYKTIDFRDIARDAFKGSALTDLGAQAVPHISEAMGDPQPVTYVPNRNMVMLSIAVAVAESYGAKRVVYGAQKHDMYGYWDTTSAFLMLMNAVLQQNRKNAVRIEAPLIDLTKTEVLSRALALGVDLAHTWSCYKGYDRACGTCPTCAERLKAFQNLGMIDPIPYAGK